MTENLPQAIELSQRFDNTTPVLSRRQMGWNGILVEPYQDLANSIEQAMEISPYQYVIQQRVERAKVMLTKTDLAIADIA